MNVRQMMKAGLEMLSKTGPEAAEAHELVLWRHQIIGERSPLATGADGLDPHGPYWKTRDFVVWGTPQQTSQQGNRTFILAGAEPVRGDLLFTLAGRPKTEEAALRAPRLGRYIVLDVDPRRDHSGTLITTTVRARPDHSGQYGDYQTNPENLP